MDKQASNIIIDLYNQLPDTLLYHYTSFDNFVNIVESKSLWASEIRFLSDQSEISYTIKLFEKIITEELKNTQCHTKRLIYTLLLHHLLHDLKKNQKLFISSFTMNGDLLSQWRAYSQPGKGISFAFTARSLLAYSNMQSFKLGRCIYKTSEQTIILRKLLRYIEDLAAKKNKSSELKFKLLWGEIIEDVSPIIMQAAALFKHPSFHEEQEWRLVSPSISDYCSEYIYHRPGSSYLIPYTKFKLPYTDNVGIEIEEIIIGPSPNHEQAKDGIKCFMLKHKRSPFKLKLSDAPYRTW